MSALRRRKSERSLLILVFIDVFHWFSLRKYLGMQWSRCHNTITAWVGARDQGPHDIEGGISGQSSRVVDEVAGTDDLEACEERADRVR